MVIANSGKEIPKEFCSCPIANRLTFVYASIHTYAQRSLCGNNFGCFGHGVILMLSTVHMSGLVVALIIKLPARILAL